jgi:Tfp pilus assembly protein PilV
VIEVLIGVTILTVGLLGILGMFSSSYTSIAEGGKLTMALTAARQILEDMRTLPYDNVANLNGFDTNTPATQPASDPEREIARKWRYTLAGEGNGWTFTTAERTKWTALSTGGGIFGGSGQISVVNQSATLRLVTATVTIPGRAGPVRLATLISKM